MIKFSNYLLSLVICLVLGSWFLVLPASAEASPLSSSQLIDKAAQFDNQNVVFVGEVVGDIMHRGKAVWLSVNDGEGALGIFCPASILPEIKFVGDYKHIGDRVEVTGTFHKACAQHGGDLDIHAQQVKVIESGYAVQRKIELKRIYIILIMLAVTLILIFLRPHKQKEE